MIKKVDCVFLKDKHRLLDLQGCVGLLCIITIAKISYIIELNAAGCQSEPCPDQDQLAAICLAL